MTDVLLFAGLVASIGILFAMGCEFGRWVALNIRRHGLRGSHWRWNQPGSAPQPIKLDMKLGGAVALTTALKRQAGTMELLWLSNRRLLELTDDAIRNVRRREINDAERDRVFLEDAKKSRAQLDDLRQALEGVTEALRRSSA